MPKVRAANERPQTVVGAERGTAQLDLKASSSPPLDFKLIGLLDTAHCRP